MEFKYLIAQEKIEQLQNELTLIKETQEGFQSRPLDKLDCRFQYETQLKNANKNYSQFQQKAEPIGTQTESPIKCDFQVQANFQLENDSVAVQTIIEEIAMPNLPSFMAQTHTKKRKLSPISASCTTPTSESRDKLNNDQAYVQAIVGDSSSIDESILNSEVYKIYCGNEDPKEAMKQFKELKTCIFFEEPDNSSLTEKDLKDSIKKALDKLWEVEPRTDSKFDKIKKYVDRKYTWKDREIFNLTFDMAKILSRGFTQIKMSKKSKQTLQKL